MGQSACRIVERTDVSWGNESTVCWQMDRRSWLSTSPIEWRRGRRVTLVIRIRVKVNETAVHCTHFWPEEEWARAEKCEGELIACDFYDRLIIALDWWRLIEWRRKKKQRRRGGTMRWHRVVKKRSVHEWCEWRRGTCLPALSFSPDTWFSRVHFPRTNQSQEEQGTGQEKRHERQNDMKSIRRSRWRGREKNHRNGPWHRILSSFK